MGVGPLSTEMFRTLYCDIFLLPTIEPSSIPVVRISRVASWNFLENCGLESRIEEFAERCAFSKPGSKRMDPGTGVGA